jgi:hypothetical protein
MTISRQTTNQPAKNDEPTSVIGLLLRLFWMFLGNIALGVSILMVLAERETVFSVADIIYGISLPLLVAARYLEITRYKGTTAEGEPATISHWKRYTVALLVFSIGAWSLCHGISFWVGP